MKNRAIGEFKIQVMDEREGIRDVWRITNPAELEDGWLQGQANIEAINQDVNYWVSYFPLFSFLLAGLLS